MRRGTIVILTLLFIAGIGGSVRAQFSPNRDINRWIRRKEPVIDSIIVEGNNKKQFPDSKIRSQLFSRKNNFLLAIKKDRRRQVQRETVRKDTAGVKYLYLSHGYLGVRVNETFEPLPPDSNGAIVRIMINEGRLFVYDKLSLNGTYGNKFDEKLNGIINQFKPGNPVDPFSLKQATYDIKSVFANDGYPYAKADYTIDTLPNNELTDVKFFVQADSLVHFGDIIIRGADKFDTSLVERELTFKKGDEYRRKDIINSQKRLLETGYYLTLYLSSIKADTLTGYSRLNPDFILSLREKKTHYVSIKTGAAQDSLRDMTWTLSGSWGKRNLFRSRWLELTASASYIIFTEWRLKDHWYRARLTEPWFIGIRMPLTLSIQYSPGVKTAIQDLDYRKESWSVSVSTTRYLNVSTRLTSGLQYESVNIYGLSLADQERLKQDEGISIRRKLYIDILRDTRNHPFVPNRGSVTSIRGEYIGGFLGGDDSFTILEASWSKYQKVWPGWTSAFRIKTGYVRQFDQSLSVPVDDRYYIGGANTVRGFTEGTLGPQYRDSTGTLKPEGANIIIIANQEFRYRLIGKFWSSIFFDAGNGFKDNSEIKWTNVAFSYGVGLQFISPAGPLRIDYARRIRTKSIAAGGKFHFTILYAF